MNVGYINYLNCFPFYYSMFDVEPVDGINIIPAYPGELNGMIRRGELVMSPVSAGAYPYLQKDCVILPDFCLSSVGYVKSVILQSHVPIEDLNGRRVGLTTASETSVALLKILLSRYYKVSPEYVPVRPRPDMSGIDAALVIGNDAMIEPVEPVEYVYDLGDLWMRKTGFPVVFAVFLARRDAVESYPEMIRRVCTSYKKSLEIMRNERGLVVSRASDMYPEIRYDISKYYSYLKFEFTSELKDALCFYYREAFEEGVLEKVDRLEFAWL